MTFKKNAWILLIIPAALTAFAFINTSTPSWTFNPTIPLANLTQNNTSACGSGTAPCTTAWNQTQTVTYDSGTYKGQTRTVDGFWDNSVSLTASTPTATCGVSGACQGSISKIPVSVLLPGYSVPVVVETQDWWGNGNGHVDNGENSENTTQVKNEMADHVSRGFAGQVLDWYGYSSGGKVIGSDDQQDIAAQAINSNIPNYQYGPQPYKFALMIDKGFFDGCGNTVACLNEALAYMATAYFGSPYYMKDSSGHPLVYFFINSFYPQQYAVLTSAGISYHNSKFVMYEPNGFPGNDPANTDGEYSWVNPADAGYETVSGSKGTFSIDESFAFSGFQSFLLNAEKNQGSMIVSEVYKGFDDNLANWSLNRIVDQDCGLTWPQTFDYTSGPPNVKGSGFLSNLNYLKSGYKMNQIMVDTWDDYEEGTEIETGINNCMNAFTPSVNTSTGVLSWTPSFGKDPMSGVSGSEATVYKYAVYVQTESGGDVQWLTDVTCSNGNCGHSVNLKNLSVIGGPYVFYVQAVGQPSITNTLSAKSNAWSSAAPSPSPTAKPTPTPTVAGDPVVTITAPKNGQGVTSPVYIVAKTTGGTGGISAMQIYYDTFLYQNISNVTSINLPVTIEGSHQIQVKAWDNHGDPPGEATITVTGSCSATQVASQLPGNGATVKSPFTVSGTACSPAGIASMQIYLDSKLYFTTNTDNMSQAVSAAVGAHTVVVKAWPNSGGSVQTSNFAVTVQ